jgi:hypothetical protein
VARLWLRCSIATGLEHGATGVVMNEQRLVLKNLHRVLVLLPDWRVSAANLQQFSRPSAGNFGKGFDS